MDKVPSFSSLVPLCSENQCDAGASAGEGGDCGEDASESLDDDSSSSIKNVEEQLHNFRSQWKLELESNSAKFLKPSSFQSEGTTERKHPVQDDHDIEKRAKEFFDQGIHAEEAGLLYEAVSFYKKALQLVPDIEFRMSEQNVHPRERNVSESISEDGDASFETRVIDPEIGTDEEENKEQDLVIRFQHFRQKHDGLYCLPAEEQKVAHISDLPVEVLVYILKWVVSVDLDLKSLEQFSMVCRGFYLCSRDEEIWRLSCIRIWGLKCPKKALGLSWRQMYLEKHHLRYSGCYISKTTYVRHGETSYIDETYRPWYLVEYYRYLRFFPEGIVLMLTTPDNPYISLSKLRFRVPRFTSVMVGHYRLVENRVMAILKRRKAESTKVQGGYYRRHRRSNVENQDTGEQTFHLELEVEHFKKRPNYRLVWKHYSIHTLYKSGQEAVANFDLNSNNFTSFWFSCVRSYAISSDKPLL